MFPRPLRNSHLRAWILLSAALVAWAGAAHGAPILAPDHVSLRTLENGLRVVVKHEPGHAAVALALYVRAGSLYEPGGQSGVAYLVERVLLLEKEGENRRFLPEVQELGGEVLVTVTRDFVEVTITVGRDDAPEALKLLRRRLDQADFSAEAVAREREAIEQFIDRVGTVPSVTAVAAYLTRALWETALHEHPYRNPSRGTRDSVPKLTAEQAGAFFERYYVPGNMSLIVVGGASADEAEGWAKEAFGDLPAREAGWTRPEAEPPQQGPRVRVERDQRTPVTMVATAYRAPGIENKRDVCTMDVIYTLLGQGEFGWLQSELQQELKLALTADVHFLTQKEPGLFIVTLSVPPQKELAARKALEGKLAQLGTDPVPPERLAQAKRLLRANYAFQNETATDQTGSLGFYDAIDTYEFAVDYINQVNAVTAEDILRVAETYFVPDKASRMIVRPKKAGAGGEEARLR